MTNTAKKQVYWRFILTMLSALWAACSSASSSVWDRIDVHETALLESSGQQPGDLGVGLATQVADLRQQPVVRSPSSAVGTLPGAASVGMMGRARYEIPIDVSPGPQGIQPGLSIQYDGHGGDGVLGVGFSVGPFPTIARCDLTIADDGVSARPDYSMNDRLCWDGARMILESGGGYGAADATYRVIGKPGVSIRQYGDVISSRTSCFEVRHSGGDIADYCASMWAQVPVGGAGGSAKVPYEWHIQRYGDRHGNRIVYQYAHDYEGQAPSSIRPNTLVYGHEGEAIQREVEFVYIDRGPEDNHFGYTNRYTPTRLNKLLDRILTKGPEGDVLRDYRFTYERDAVTERTHLVSVQVFDSAGASLPPTTFEWTTPSAGLIAEYQPADPGLVQPHGWYEWWETDEGQSFFELMEVYATMGNSLSGDFDGDGLQEIFGFGTHSIDGEGHWQLYHGDAGGTTELARFTGDAWTPILEGEWLGEDGAGAEAGWFPGPAAMPDSKVLRLPNFDLQGITNGDGDVDPMAFQQFFSHLHTVGTRASMFAADISGDGLEDVVVFTADEAAGGEDPYGVPVARGIRVAVAKDTTAGGFVTYGIDHGSSEYIYSAIPMDLNHDMLHDFIMCRGPGYKSGRWVFATAKRIDLTAGEVGFDFHETSIGCSIHDEYGLTNLAHGQVLRVIPAYPRAPTGLNFQPSDYDDQPSRYVGEYLPLEPGDRGDYRFLSFNGGAGELTESNLPRDLYQRYHDSVCYNVHPQWSDMYGVTNPGPVFGAGMTKDVSIDLNGDGYADLLRARLASGDGVANLNAITAGFDGWDNSWLESAGARCADQPGETLIIDAYLNDGVDYVYAGQVFEFAGDPHANLWMNWKRSVLYDRNHDGRIDILLPGVGQDVSNLGLSGDFVVLQSGVEESFDVHEITELPAGWPHYHGQIEWEDELVDALLNQAFPIGFSGLENTALAFWGPSVQGTPEWEHLMNRFSRQGTVFIDRVTSITNGIGLTTTFSYEMARTKVGGGEAYPAVSITRPLAMVNTMSRDGDVDKRYRYQNCQFDALGRGFIGCEYVAVSDVIMGTTTVNRYDLSRDPSIAGYPMAGTAVETWTERRLSPAVNEVYSLSHTQVQPQVDVQNLVGGSMYFTYTAHSVVEEFEVTGSLIGAPTAYCVEVGGTISDTFSSPIPLGGCDDDLALVGQALLTEDVVAQVDEFGTATSVTRTLHPHTAGAPLADTWTKSIAYTDMINDEVNWIIGRPQTQVTTSVVPSGASISHEVEYVYDLTSGDILEKITNPDYPKYRVHDVYQYSAAGDLQEHAETADGSTRTTTYDKSADHVFVEAVTQSGVSVYAVHDRTSGDVLASVNPQGVTEHSRYDGFGRVTRNWRTDAPMGADEGWFDELVYLAGVEDTYPNRSAYRIRRSSSDGSWRMEDFDRKGQLTRSIWPGMAAIDAGAPLANQSLMAGDEIYVEHVYNDRGLITETTLPAYMGQIPAGSTSFEYDGLNRKTRVLHPDGTDETWAYTTHARDTLLFGTEGHQTTYTDRMGSQTVFRQNVMKQEIGVRDADGVWTEAAYDERGLFEITVNADAPAPEQRITALENNYIFQTEEIHDAIQGTRMYEHSARGALISRTNAFGQTTTFVRDDFDRVMSRISPEGEDKFFYSEGTNAAGLLARTESSSGVYEWFYYDSFQRLSKKRIQTTLGAPLLTYEYAYTAQGQPDTLTYPNAGGDDLVVRTHYDGIGNKRAKTLVSDGSVLWAYAEGNEPDALRREMIGEHAIREVTRAPLTGAVLTIRDYDATTLQDYINQSYTWHAWGDLERRDDNISGQSESFIYDALHRIDSWTTEAADGATDAHDMAYNAFGDITYREGVGTYIYDAFGRLNSISPSEGVYLPPADYDINGNLLEWTDQRGTRQISYRSNGRIDTVTDGGASWTHSYTANNVGVYRVHSDGTQVTSYDGFELRQDTEGDVISMQFRIAGVDRTVVEILRTPDIGGVINPEIETESSYSDERIFYHADHLGSTAARTTIDNGVASLYGTSIAYDAWGQARSADDWATPVPAEELTDIGHGPGYTGHRAELTGGYIDMGNRLYDPFLGRFTSPDILAEASSHSQRRNLYAYVLNNPVNAVDPDGLAGDNQQPTNGEGWGYGGRANQRQVACDGPNEEDCTERKITVLDPNKDYVGTAVDQTYGFSGLGGLSTWTGPSSDTEQTREFKSGGGIRTGESAYANPGMGEDRQRSNTGSSGHGRGYMSPLPRRTMTAKDSCAGKHNLVCYGMRGEEHVGEKLLYSVSKLAVCVTPGGQGVCAAVESAETAIDKGQAIANGDLEVSEAIEEAGMEIATTVLLRKLGRAKNARKAKSSTNTSKTKAEASSSNCFTGGTLVATPDGDRPIEDIAVGQRVRAKWGTMAETAVDPTTWKRVTLSMPNPDVDGDVYDIELLRPMAWLRQTGARVAGTIHFELEEMGLDGEALVLAIDDSPAIADGDGEVVTLTVSHLNGAVFEVQIEETGEIIETTVFHPFFSVTRDDWVQTWELQPGEQLWTPDGHVHVASIAHKPGVFRVYNIEVEDAHNYMVGDSAVLVHNTCSKLVGNKRSPALKDSPHHPDKVRERQVKNDEWYNRKRNQQAARGLGYNRRIPANRAPFNSHGQTVYGNGNGYITKDIDSHNGGVWKKFDRRGRRVGTYDANLNRIGD